MQFLMHRTAEGLNLADNSTRFSLALLTVSATVVSSRFPPYMCRRDGFVRTASVSAGAASVICACLFALLADNANANEASQLWLQG